MGARCCSFLSGRRRSLDEAEEDSMEMTSVPEHYPRPNPALKVARAAGILKNKAHKCESDKSESDKKETNVKRAITFRQQDSMQEFDIFKPPAALGAELRASRSQLSQDGRNVASTG